ncbi:Na+/H+ antiporter [Curtobacterium sp. MCBD17_035]|uniref:Na+/H+ antiporter n=1 Tax=Curtobacterium sp. MCBD17_035 TaxID=2175673 RepID=UPI000DAABDF4|nr:Na+/H+ antiporter [Curtobacterium sp. MCBD17_035]WIB68114.1 Na+/H+ antiporter [Curtobacterium sp. MCBD17_035]
MDGLELAVVLGATILVGGVVAQRIRVAAPLVLLVLGAGVGFLPGLGGVRLPSEAVLLLFLPALLYWESLNTSLREIRSNLRTIALLAVGLVFATAAVVAVVAHLLGLTWALSITLGAVLAPTDATAVAAVAARLPRRLITTLRAESLVNDGTALVLYSVAVGAVVSGQDIDVWGAVVRFFASYGFGIAIGLAVGLIVYWVRRYLDNRLLENTLSVLTPFLAYLPAELFGVSGVVSVVTAGLLLTQIGHRVISAHARIQGYGFWQVTSYLLNGALFVLVGLDFHPTLLAVLHDDWVTALALGLGSTAAVIGMRFLWVNTTPYASRLLDRRAGERDRHLHFRERMPIAWAGFRGAVSLAAALGVPRAMSDGSPVHDRDLVIAATFVVILVTLVVEGLTMPVIVRWARLPEDPEEQREEIEAERAALQGALDSLDDVASRLESPEEVREDLRADYGRRLERLRRDAEAAEGDAAAASRAAADAGVTVSAAVIGGTGGSAGEAMAAGADGSDAEDPIGGAAEDATDVEPDEIQLEREAEQADIALRLALLEAKRAAVDDLRRSRAIDDAVMRRVQSRFDVEELRLAAISEDD